MIAGLKKQKGYTLIEIIIGVALAGILTSGITTFTVLTITESARSNNRMEALMQVENAGYWVSRDIQMSSNMTLGENAGFPLLLQWNDVDLNEYDVTYSLSEGRIRRNVVKNNQETVETLIAQSINPESELTSCVYDDGLLTFNVTATCGSVDVSRSYQVKNRVSLE